MVILKTKKVSIVKEEKQLRLRLILVEMDGDVLLSASLLQLLLSSFYGNTFEW